MAAYDITLHGCDDQTTVTMTDLTPGEVSLLQVIAGLTRDASKFDCQPKMTVTEHTEVITSE